MKVQFIEFHFLLDPDQMSISQHLQVTKHKGDFKLFTLTPIFYIVMVNEAERYCKQQQGFRGPLMKREYEKV